MLKRFPRILAIIVTHNRRDLLERCVKNVLSQSRAPSEILVINNASTDSTLEYLINNNINHLTQENLGSAGGWNRGIEYALENSFDLCWLMDDDGFPAHNSLELLCSKINKDISCISSAVIQEDSRNHFVFPLPKLNSKGFPTLWPIKRKHFNLSSSWLSKNETYNFAHLFNGALISCAAIKKIGNVDMKFYMMGDEVDYFFRLKSVGKVLTLLQSHHFHPAVTSRPYSIDKIFYLIRNTLYLHNKYFDYPLLRNILVVPLIIFRSFRRNGARFIIKLLLNRDLLIFQAIKDGIKGNFSIR